MSLITFSESVGFNLEIIRVGGFIRAKHYSWREARNGLVVAATRRMIHVLYQPLNGATSYFAMRASEVQNDEWLLRYSNDLKEMTRVEDGELDTEAAGE